MGRIEGAGFEQRSEYQENKKLQFSAEIFC